MTDSDFFDLVRAIAARLPTEWNYFTKGEHHDFNHGSAQISGPHGLVLNIRERWEGNGLLHVCGGWPSLGNTFIDPVVAGVLPPGSSLPGINISRSRQPSSLAKDIERRFIDDYIELYNQCLAYKTRRISELDSLHQLIVKLRSVGNLTSSESLDLTSTTHTLFRYESSEQRYDYYISTGSGRCRATLNGLPLDLAIQIAAIVDLHHTNNY